MSKSHPSPMHHINTGTLTIAVLPLCIYFLQLAGKVSALAAFVAGILVILKVALEWSNHWQRTSHQSVRRVSMRPRAPVVLVAPCYLCNKMEYLHPYRLDHHHVGICQKCHHCLNFTDQR